MDIQQAAFADSQLINTSLSVRHTDQQCVILCGVPGVGRSSAALELVRSLRTMDRNWAFIDSDVLFQPSWRADLSDIGGIEVDTPDFRRISRGARVSRQEFLAQSLRFGHDVVFTETMPTITDPNFGLVALQERFPGVRFSLIYLELKAESEQDVVKELRRRLEGRAVKDPDGYGRIDRRKLADPDYYTKTLSEHDNLLKAHKFKVISCPIHESSKEIASRMLDYISINKAMTDLALYQFDDGGGI